MLYDMCVLMPMQNDEQNAFHLFVIFDIYNFLVHKQQSYLDMFEFSECSVSFVYTVLKFVYAFFTLALFSKYNHSSTFSHRATIISMRFAKQEGFNFYCMKECLTDFVIRI